MNGYCWGLPYEGMKLSLGLLGFKRFQGVGGEGSGFRRYRL